MQYVLLCGVSAAELTRLSNSPGPVAGTVRESARQMQQAAAALRRAGVPMRSFLAPYVDTVQLQNDSPAFFGSRMLLTCDSALAHKAKQICAPFSLLRTYVSATPMQPFSRCPMTERRCALLRSALEQFAVPAAALALFSFSAPALCDRYAGAAERRAQSREVLAFGEICARMAKNAGGELISCAGGEMVLLPGAERQEELLQEIGRVYDQRMAPHCGAEQEKLRIRVLRETENL